MNSRDDGRTLRLSDDLIRALVGAVTDDLHGTRTETICERLDESPQRLGDAFEYVKENGILLGFAGLWLHPERYDEATERFLTALADVHRTEPGNGAVVPREIAQRAELDWTSKAAARVAGDLIASGRLKGDEEGVRLPGFVPTIGTKQEITLTRLVEALNAAGFRPPVGQGFAVAVNLPSQAMDEILRVGEHTGRLVPMENGLWTTPELLDRAHRELKRGARNGTVTIADARTLLEASRRYAHAFLLHLAQDGRAEPGNGDWRLL